MRTLIFSLLFMAGAGAFAQSGDSLEVYREFSRVCNGYKQLPLYVKLDYERKSSLPLEGEDTITTRADFHIKSGGAYIRFGPLEQVINDSLVLVVMDNAKQMILSPAGNSVEAQLKMMMGPSVIADTSVQKTAARYAAKKSKNSDNSMEIRISSRNLIYGTQDPSEETILTYEKETGNPKKIVTIKRRIIPEPLDAGFDQEKLKAVKKIPVPGKGNLLIKEDITTYYYREISHDDRKLPVVITDRLMKGEEENLVPVKTYADYILFNN